MAKRSMATLFTVLMLLSLLITPMYASAGDEKRDNTKGELVGEVSTRLTGRVSTANGMLFLGGTGVTSLFRGSCPPFGFNAPQITGTSRTTVDDTSISDPAIRGEFYKGTTRLSFTGELRELTFDSKSWDATGSCDGPGYSWTQKSWYSIYQGFNKTVNDVPQTLTQTIN